MILNIVNTEAITCTEGEYIIYQCAHAKRPCGLHWYTLWFMSLHCVVRKFWMCMSGYAWAPWMGVAEPLNHDYLTERFKLALGHCAFNQNICTQALPISYTYSCTWFFHYISVCMFKICIYIYVHSWCIKSIFIYRELQCYSTWIYGIQMYGYPLWNPFCSLETAEPWPVGLVAWSTPPSFFF